MTIRTRFAPSPTGYLHVGGVRTALFAWLLAKQKNGQFILRIEDTDRQREVAGSETHIKESLAWLGLVWDEGPDKQGELGPYRQSERLNIYKDWAVKLLEKGRAYADPTTPEELNSLRQKAKEEKSPFLFRDHRPSNPPQWDESMPLRFKSEPAAYKWQDEVMGKLSSGPEVIDDFILIKSDGYPTYNFAHIVDDHLMQVTHVIRSQEFLASVPKFLNLYDALEIKRPVLATMPYVMGPDGKKKLSKRDGAKDVLDYRNEGFLPGALINFMATLGWNDGSTQEIFPIEELIEKFSLARVQKSGARFDEQRLLWMNGQFIRKSKPAELYEALQRDEGHWWKSAEGAEMSYKIKVLELVKERLKFFKELDALTHFFFKEPSSEDVSNLLHHPPDKKLKDLTPSEMKATLQAAYEKLAKSSFEQDNIQLTLNSLLEEKSLVPAILFPLIRIAVTGEESSPEIFGTLRVIGKEKSLSRITSALALLDS